MTENFREQLQMSIAHQGHNLDDIIFKTIKKTFLYLHLLQEEFWKYIALFFF